MSDFNVDVYGMSWSTYALFSFVMRDLIVTPMDLAILATNGEL